MAHQSFRTTTVARTPLTNDTASKPHVHKYALASYVYGCIEGGNAVFLDSRNDRYIGLDRTQVEALSGLVEGWPETENATSAAVRAISPIVGELLERLLRGGLLTDFAVAETRSASSAIPAPTASLVQVDIAEAADVRAKHAWHMLRATVFASHCLRFRSLEHIVNAIARCKRQHPSKAKIADIERAKTLLKTFSHLRPLFYTARDQCLFDSLALGRFLALHEIPTSLVIGVKSRPFAAHCWLQIGSFVLNGAADHVRTYKPILVA